MTKIESSFLKLWFSLGIVFLVIFLLARGEIAKEPTYLSIDNLILCNGEKIIKAGLPGDNFYIQGNNFVFCGNLNTDSPVYLLGYLYYETTDNMPIGIFSDSELHESGPINIKITTKEDSLTGRYVLQIWRSRKIIKEYKFNVISK